MSDSSDLLADLVSSARKELARLQRTEELDLRSELRHRVWPFLLELAEIAQESFVDDEAAAISVDLVARAVGLVLGMANRLSEFVGEGEMQDLAARAAEVTEELMALCDPDELASYVAPGAEPILDADTVEAPSGGVVASDAEKARPETPDGSSTIAENAT
jgi:hypothetical protein